MNSKEYWGLMEAYAEVYAPDLIDEDCVEEQRLSGQQRRAQQASLRQQGGPLGQRRAAVQSSGGPRGQGNNLLRRPGDPGRTSQPTTRIDRGSRPTPAAKPAPTPAAKPAPTPAAKPAPTPTTSTSTTSAAPKRTFNPLMQKTFGYQTGKAPDQVAKTTSSTSTASRNLTGTGALGTPKKPTTSAAKPAPTPVNRATGSKKPGSVYSGFDMFDLVKGHLLDEGYADTEEAAIAIMANMSEEWRESILDEADSLAAMQARREKRLKAQRKREGTTVTGRDFGRDDRLTSDQQKERRDAEYKKGTKK